MKKELQHTYEILRIYVTESLSSQWDDKIRQWLFSDMQNESKTKALQRLFNEMVAPCPDEHAEKLFETMKPIVFAKVV
ncbi:MAG: hypothetical protein LBR06_00585 [Bacteroidales bacterium]|jgi:hypothetical protein|nr:hypothetical protein [Bacteroidales bacterium]